MKQSLIEKLKWWLCDNFGHIRLDGKPWNHGGQRHETCKFCRRTHSTKAASGNNKLG